MQYLVDTGIWLRLFDRTDPEHADICEALRLLRSGGHSLTACPQNIAEFWNVSTRPKDKNGGLELTVETVSRRLRVIERLSTVLSESSASFEEWKRLLTAHRVLGVKVHDARLVSVMLVSKVPTVLTLNNRDFQRYSEISAMTPNDIVAQAK